MPQLSPHPSSVTFAERVGGVAAVAMVTAISDLSPSIREVVLHHRDAVALAGEPGQDVMVLIDVDHDRPRRRRYTVRSVNAEAETLSIWIAHDHTGPGISWLEGLNVGDAVDVIGPRGKILLDPLADWHLFVGDVSSMGAFFRLAESIDPPGNALFVIELSHPDDLLVPDLHPDIAPTGVFVDRRDADPADVSALLTALAAVELPRDEGHAYLFGELGVNGAVRAALIDRGMTPEQLSVKAFWRNGVGNADHGEPPKE